MPLVCAKQGIMNVQFVRVFICEKLIFNLNFKIYILVVRNHRKLGSITTPPENTPQWTFNQIHNYSTFKATLTINEQKELAFEQTLKSVNASVPLLSPHHNRKRHSPHLVPRALHVGEFQQTLYRAWWLKQWWCPEGLRKGVGRRDGHSDFRGDVRWSTTHSW